VLQDLQLQTLTVFPRAKLLPSQLYLMPLCRTRKPEKIGKRKLQTHSRLPNYATTVATVPTAAAAPQSSTWERFGHLFCCFWVFLDSFVDGLARNISDEPEQASIKDSPDRVQIPGFVGAIF